MLYKIPQCQLPNTQMLLKIVVLILVTIFQLLDLGSN